MSYEEEDFKFLNLEEDENNVTEKPPMKSGTNAESLTTLKMSDTNAESLTTLKMSGTNEVWHQCRKSNPTENVWYQ